MKVAICIEVKNENRYIREWLEYHDKLGFDNIILYDNNDSNGENIFDVIGDEIKNGFVIYENIKDKTNYQLPCYNECMEKYHNDFDWILFLDCDEFLELRSCNKIKDWLTLSKFNDYEQILINLENYGDNNFVYDDGRSVLNRFLMKKERTFQDACLSTKPCLKMANYNSETFIYKGFPNCIELYNTTCDVNGDKIFPSRILFTENEDCVIRHYKTKTIEEYIERHKNDCHYDTNIQLVAKKIKGFFEVNNGEYKINEKIDIIKKEFPWYSHHGNKSEKIDIVLIDDGNPILPFTIKSIKENISWYNKIYVVSNNNLNIDDIIVVNTNDIIPNGFEDTDIALFLHNIEELSERFIYVYSGTIFNYICFEDEFFNGNKICMQPVNFNVIPKKNKKICFENNRFFLNRKDITCNETFRVSKANFGYMFSRTCCPMLKSDNKSCFEYMKCDIEKNKNKINHLIYPTWTRLMYNNFDYIHTNVSIEECEDKLLEIEDPIYKIINIPIKYINKSIIEILNKRYV